MIACQRCGKLSLEYGLHTCTPLNSQPSVSQDGELLNKIPTIGSLFNMIGDLSMKLNMMQSSLRQFEKQKVDPIIDSIADIRMCIHNHGTRLNDVLSKHDSLFDACHIGWTTANERHTRQVDENRKISRRVDELDDVLVRVIERVKDLEESQILYKSKSVERIGTRLQDLEVEVFKHIIQALNRIDNRLIALERNKQDTVSDRQKKDGELMKVHVEGQMDGIKFAIKTLREIKHSFTVLEVDENSLRGLDKAIERLCLLIKE